jgi:crotonobetainyl-CoA:carnitine CoA-transferase CaiB-like acyl-CoA transferase
VADLARACVAACALAAAALAAARGAAVPEPLVLSNAAVATAFTSERHLRRDDPAWTPFAPLSRFWPTADGWVRTHANYPHHRSRLLAALGCPPEAVGATLRGMASVDVEAAVTAAGGLAVAVRRPAAWVDPGRPTGLRREAAGAFNASQPGTDEPGTSWRGIAEAGASEPGTDQPRTSGHGIAEPGPGRSGTAGSGASEPGIDQPRTSGHGGAEPGAGRSGTAGSGTAGWGERERGARGDGTQEAGAGGDGTHEAGAGGNGTGGGASGDDASGGGGSGWWAASLPLAAELPADLLRITRTPVDGRPLGAAPAGLPAAGVRVLDLTRVIAGPVATRTLALLGADVLRIDPPGLPEIPEQHLDTGFGKRSTLLDLADVGDRAVFDELLGTADVVVTGYRPGALDRLGVTPDALRERRPDLVVARLSAWGEGGGRGFDSLVQAASGIAVVEGDGAPGALPAQALDHGTGYLLAAAVLLALADRGRGVAHTVDAALAATARWLLDAPRAPRPAEPIEPTTSTAGGLTYALPAFTLPGGPRTWASPPTPWGRDRPQWRGR